MAEQIDRPGVFRGKLTEWGVSATKNGFPQFVGRVAATQFYVDASEAKEFGLDEAGWADWEAYDQEALIYLVLFNNDGPLMNYEQVQKAFGWDGASFAALGALDLADHEFLFRVEYDEYQGKTRLRVQWVDDADAPPSRELNVLDESKLKDLDSQFGSFMNAKKKGAPAKAKKSEDKAKAKPKAKPKAKAEKKESAPPAKKSPPKAKKSEDKAEDEEAVPCTKLEAWEFLSTTKPESMSDDELADAWFEACEEVLGESDEDEATKVQWGEIKILAAQKLNLIPF